MPANLIDHALAKQRTTQGHMARLTGGIGEYAAALLFLRWGWLPRPVPSFTDQGTDLMVEVAEEGVGTGFHFHVSAKATKEVGADDAKYVSVSLEKSSVDYLAVQSSVVFLLLVRDTVDQAYWLDLRSDLTSNKRTAKGGMVVRIPTSQVLHLDRRGDDV